MYYQTLLTLEKKYDKKIIEIYDAWLFNLPQRVSDRISIAKASNELNMDLGQVFRHIFLRIFINYFSIAGE